MSGSKKIQEKIARSSMNKLNKNIGLDIRDYKLIFILFIIV